jgi:hypothetical protein
LAAADCICYLPALLLVACLTVCLAAAGCICYLPVLLLVACLTVCWLLLAAFVICLRYYWLPA